MRPALKRWSERHKEARRKKGLRYRDFIRTRGSFHKGPPVQYLCRPPPLRLRRLFRIYNNDGRSISNSYARHYYIAEQGELRWTRTFRPSLRYGLRGLGSLDVLVERTARTDHRRRENLSARAVLYARPRSEMARKACPQRPACRFIFTVGLQQVPVLSLFSFQAFHPRLHASRRPTAA